MNIEHVDDKLIAKDSARLILDFIYSSERIGSDEYCRMYRKLEKIPEEVKQVMFCDKFRYLGSWYKADTFFMNTKYYLKYENGSYLKYENGKFYVRTDGLVAETKTFEKITDMITDCIFGHFTTNSEVLDRLRRLAE